MQKFLLLIVLLSLSVFYGCSEYDTGTDVGKGVLNPNLTDFEIQTRNITGIVTQSSGSYTSDTVSKASGYNLGAPLYIGTWNNEESVVYFELDNQKIGQFIYDSVFNKLEYFKNIGSFKDTVSLPIYVELASPVSNPLGLEYGITQPINTFNKFDPLDTTTFVKQSELTVTTTNGVVNQNFEITLNYKTSKNRLDTLVLAYSKVIKVDRYNPTNIVEIDTTPQTLTLIKPRADLSHQYKGGTIDSTKATTVFTDTTSTIPNFGDIYQIIHKDTTYTVQSQTTFEDTLDNTINIYTLKNSSMKVVTKTIETMHYSINLQRLSRNSLLTNSNYLRLKDTSNVSGFHKINRIYTKYLLDTIQVPKTVTLYDTNKVTGKIDTISQDTTITVFIDTTIEVSRSGNIIIEKNGKTEQNNTVMISTAAGRHGKFEIDLSEMWSTIGSPYVFNDIPLAEITVTPKSTKIHKSHFIVDSGTIADTMSLKLYYQFSPYSTFNPILTPANNFVTMKQAGEAVTFSIPTSLIRQYMYDTTIPNKRTIYLYVTTDRQGFAQIEWDKNIAIPVYCVFSNKNI